MPTETDVVRAIKTGDPQKLVEILQKFPDFPRFSISPLKEAVALERVDLLRILIEYKAELNFSNGRLLEIAAEKGNVSIVRCLIDCGIDATGFTNNKIATARKKGLTEIADLIEQQKSMVAVKPVVSIPEMLRKKRDLADRILKEKREQIRIENEEERRRSEEDHRLRMEEFERRMKAIKLPPPPAEPSPSRYIVVHHGDSQNRVYQRLNIKHENLASFSLFKTAIESKLNMTISSVRYFDNTTRKKFELCEDSNMLILVSQNVEFEIISGSFYDDCKKRDVSEVLIPNWKCKIKGTNKHDFFISHRTKSESELARIFALYLERNTHLHAFISDHCLVEGQRWEPQFLTGLFSSKVIVLLCSEKALESVKSADTLPDDMFLEWELALDFFDERKAKVLPLLVGEDTHPVENGRKRIFTKHFDTFDYSMYPALKHCHKFSPRKRTIRDSIKYLFEIQAARVDSSNILSAAERVIELYSQFQESGEI